MGPRTHVPPDSPALTPHIPDPGSFLFIDRSPLGEPCGGPGRGGGGGRWLAISIQALLSYPHVAFTISFRTRAHHLFLKHSQLPLKHILQTPSLRSHASLEQLLILLIFTYIDTNWGFFAYLGIPYHAEFLPGIKLFKYHPHKK